MKTRLFLITVGVILGLTACSAHSNGPSETPLAETATEQPASPGEEGQEMAELTPTSTLSPTPTERIVLLEDDFSDISSGWERYREFDGVLDYEIENEVYQMMVLADDNLWWVFKEEALPEVVMGVDVWQVDGPEGSLFGLMCRYDPDSLDGIVFLISTEGQAGIGTINNGFDPLPGGELAYFDAIETGMNAKNTIEAACIGEALTLTVNGDVLFELPAPESVGEFIGLAVATPLGAGADVYFDNLVVYTP